MAPEQAGGSEIGTPADVWGLGTVLYELAGGEPAFADDPTDEYPQLHRRADPVRAARRLPSGVADTIDACLEPELAQRPKLDELIDALLAFAADPATAPTADRAAT